MLSAERLHQQSRILFAALVLAVPALFFTISPDNYHYERRYILVPIFMLFLWGFASTMRDLKVARYPGRARRFIRSGSRFSLIISVLCSYWAVQGWLGSAEESRMHYPLVLAMGALASGYCLASVRAAAIGHLTIDILPISLLMIFTGTGPEMAAGISMLVASAFQLSMINSHHHSIVDLLLMRRQARLLAETDPLTELPNRRVMMDRIFSMGQKHRHVRLMLIDIDEFKSINDRFGHEIGDKVLCEVAALIGRHASGAIGVARLGGEEFGIYGPADRLDPALAIALLSDIRNHPMPHGQQVTVSIGIDTGRCSNSEQWGRLFAGADRALYQAKSSGRNCLFEAADLEPVSGENHIGISAAVTDSKQAANARSLPSAERAEKKDAAALSKPSAGRSAA